MLTRRRLLSLSAAVVATATAGCTGETAPSGVRVAAVELENAEQTARTFDVTVTADGETVFETRRSVSAGGAAVVEDPVPEAGNYTVTVATDATDAETATAAADTYADEDEDETCVVLVARTSRAEGETRLQLSGRGYTSCEASTESEA